MRNLKDIQKYFIYSMENRLLMSPFEVMRIACSLKLHETKLDVEKQTDEL